MSKQCNMLIDYFNRTLTDEEINEFEEHLIGCESCQEELIEWETLTEDLPFLSEEVEVPSGMKAKVFAAIAETPETPETPVEQKTIDYFPPIQSQNQPKKRFRFMLPTVAAALLISLLSNIYLINENTKAPEIAVSDIEVIGKTVLAAQPGVEDASAVAMLLSDKGEPVLVVDAENLPVLGEGELYQVWVIEGEQPYPAGVIELTETGGGKVSHPLANLDGKWDTIAITIEKEPNLPLPEGVIVLAGGI
ncbi:anti-sigma factor [Sporosarcina sp. CAU 1771]